MKLEFSASSLSDCDFVRNEFAVFLDLDGHSEVLVEQFFCITDLHASFNLKALCCSCVNSLCSLVVQLLKCKCAICNLLSLIKYEFYTKRCFKFSRKSLEFLLR